MKNNSKIAANFYLARVRAYPVLLTGVLLTVPFTILVNAYLPPLIVANVLSKLSTNNYAASDLWPVFGLQLVLYTFLLLGGIATWRLVDFFAWKLEAKVQRDIAEIVFEHMLRESADFHANNFSGSLVSQNAKLLGGYIRTADTTIFSTYPLFVGLIFTNIILVNRATLFVAILDVFAILFIAVALKISKPVRVASQAVAAAESKQTGHLADAITNVMTIKSFARADFEKRRFRAASARTQQALYGFAQIHRQQMNWLGFLSRIISGSALALAVIAVIFYNANLGTMFLILSFTSRIVDQLFEFSNGALRNYARALGDAADLVAILQTEPSVVDPVKPVPVAIKDGSINFNQVHFTHGGAREAIFEGLSITIAQGENVGIVGHSGSGKTTLTKLLLRFADIDSGQITIGGQNIASITQADLHRNIAYVPQEPLLFHRTIRENIAYGKEKATNAEIKAASQKAHADEFVAKLPQGYDTLVGERGVKLSGGQRQRIAIARAMLKDAPVIVLDEATSALDSESEVLIQDALWKLMASKTAIVIAHRLSTIQKMDRIIVLSDGAIAEQGTHSALLKQNGIYANLWAHQSGGFIEE